MSSPSPSLPSFKPVPDAICWTEFTFAPPKRTSEALYTVHCPSCGFELPDKVLTFPYVCPACAYSDMRSIGYDTNPKNTFPKIQYALHAGRSSPVSELR